MEIARIGNLVRMERIRRGLTQGEVAKRSGVSKGRVEALENNRCNDMGYNTVRMILDVLDIDIILEPAVK